MVQTGTGIIVAIVAILVVGGGFYAVQSGWFDSDNAALSVNDDSNDSGSITTSSTALRGGDKVEVEVSHRDSLVTTTSLTEATNVVTTELSVGADGKLFLQSSGTDQIIELTENDNGWLTLVFEPASGQQYIFDKHEFKTRNPGLVGDMTFYDWDGDGDKQWVVQVSTKGLKPQEELDAVPIRQVKVPWHNENTITLNAPSNLSSVGTSAYNADLYWEATGTSGDATYLDQIKIRWNSTTLGEVDEGNSYIIVNVIDKNSGVKTQKYLYLQDADDQIETTTYLEWRFDMGDSIGNADYWEFLNNDSTKQYLTTRLKIDLATSDVRTATIGVTTWDPANTSNAEVTDTVQITA